MSVSVLQDVSRVKFLPAFSAFLLSGLISGQALSAQPPLQIAGDKGGQIIKYALKVKKVERSARSVEFAGSCDSACTLYLSLPNSQTCIMQGASFGFHLPYGASSSGNKIALDYMWRSYPTWVRSWIRSQGGLSGNLIIMEYSFASRHLDKCTDHEVVGLSPFNG